MANSNLAATGSLSEGVPPRAKRIETRVHANDAHKRKSGVSTPPKMQAHDAGFSP